MRVFISWSGPQSLAVARALHNWLPTIIQSVKPWVSSENIESGARWNSKINKELSQVRFGIVCLTKENQGAPWLVFEAGALAKTLDDTYVVPYLIDMEVSDVEGGPLTQFQAEKHSEEGTLKLVRSMNKALGDDGLESRVLEEMFTRGWSYLKTELDSIPKSEATVREERTPEKISREVLEVVRGLSRRLDSLPTREELARIDLARRLSGGETPFDRRRWEATEELRREEMMSDAWSDMQAEEAARLDEAEAARDMAMDQAEEAQRDAEFEADFADDRDR